LINLLQIKCIMIRLFTWKKKLILRLYVILYIVCYSYVFQSLLTVWAEKVPNVYIHINSVLLSNTLIFALCCTWRLSQSREDHRPSVGAEGAEGIVWKIEATGGSWEKLSTEELHNTYCSTDIIRIVRERLIV
jgi:hypothetical protein